MHEIILELLDLVECLKKNKYAEHYLNRYDVCLHK